MVILLGIKAPNMVQELAILMCIKKGIITVPEIIRNTTMFHATVLYSVSTLRRKGILTSKIKGRVATITPTDLFDEYLKQTKAALNVENLFVK